MLKNSQQTLVYTFPGETSPVVINISFIYIILEYIV